MDAADPMALAGMRLARLEINLIIVHMLADFNWELSDKHGQSTPNTNPAIDRNSLRPERSQRPVYIRYRPRNLKDRVLSVNNVD